LFLTGCLHPLARLDQRTPVNTKEGEFEVASLNAAAPDVPLTSHAIELAAPSLFKWGKLETKVTVYLAPTHEELEEAVRRYDYTWLRAWARYDDVILQTPSSWPKPSPGPSDLEELLLHELTHCVMYQNAAAVNDWEARKIPLWFREGMATYTAHQGPRFPSLEDLARWYEKHPGDDPLLNPDPLYQKSSDVVYGVAHQAFEFLVRRHGEEAAVHLLHSMRVGRTFAQAFLDVIGIEEQAFLLDVQHYIKWRGFKGRVHLATPIQQTP
jgi:hypothetical protein